MSIHPDSISQVKESTNIVDVVGDYVVLKKVGQNQVGNCPFHDDKSPSFCVTEDKQLYHCFGCGEGGDVISFLTKINNQSFSEAVEDLAARRGITLEFEGKETKEDYQAKTQLIDKLREIMEVARSYYAAQLLDKESGELARDYLINRKLTPDAIAHFQLGYAPREWTSLYDFLVHERCYDAEVGLKAGLFIKKNDQYLDRFRGRLMFPIFDHLNRVIAFSGRALNLTDQPKYLHSPETKLFNKSQVLYGLNHAIKSIGQEDFAIVVEGYFDAIALYQAGIKNVVACQGTALTRSQVNKALKYTRSKKLVILFDGDIPGQKASEKTIETLADLVNSEQVDLRLLSLPGNQDPDDWLKTNSPDKFSKLLESAPYWVHWLFNRFIEGKDLTNPHDIVNISENFAKTLSKLQSESLQSYYTIYAGELLGCGDIHQAKFYSDSLSKTIGKPIKASSPAPIKDKEVDFVPSSGLSLINAWVQHPGKRGYINAEIINHDIVFIEDSTRKIWNYLINSDSNLTVAELMDKLIEEFKFISPIEQLEFLVTWHKVEPVDGWIKQLRRDAINAQIDYYKNLWTNCDQPQQNKYYFDTWNKLVKLLDD